MTDPGTDDTSVFGEVASEIQDDHRQKSEKWCFADLSDVQTNDDYGHWRGAKRAVDEFFQAEEYRPLLNRVGYTCRLVIKI
jgi:hypothetical protein